MKNFKSYLPALLLCLAGMVAVPASAQYSQLHNFDWHVEGANPNYPAMLAQGPDGNLYGTLQTSDPNDGSVFMATPQGAVAPLAFFNGPNGSAPQSGLTLGLDGNFYGSTVWGGSQSSTGTAFKFGAGGITDLHAFANGSDGGYPWVPPIMAPDGNLYGVTDVGTSPGQIYRVAPDGTGFKVIATAPSNTQAPLSLGNDGNLYGTSQYGGKYNRGTIFQVSLPKGKVKIIHQFNPNTEGSVPFGPVLLNSDGNLYGTTSGGGKYGQGIIYRSTLKGKLTVLHDFQGAEGSNSTAGLLPSGEVMYGVCSSGGAFGFGTLFMLFSNEFVVLHDFQEADGATPYSTPILHTNGNIYGLTNLGGTPNAGYGVLYQYQTMDGWSVVPVVLKAARVGDTVQLLGQGFTSATSVVVGLVNASFNVISDTFMTVQIPEYAISALIDVHYANGGVASSQQGFLIIPQLLNFSPPRGPAGTLVTINGESLSETTDVTFGGVSASFTVISDKQITATVPAKAKSGKIVITTFGGTATSKGKFVVQ
ncbi:MAG TPA: choice-of-anchor tandem repeat GloVer-containing protein [Terriglobales bacterium]|nr:choice-of-anchor tandem repeat GloVer-containing protein [Terriglobales bacterium]